jgi:hypothetical protein
MTMTISKMKKLGDYTLNELYELATQYKERGIEFQMSCYKYAFGDKMTLSVGSIEVDVRYNEYLDIENLLLKAADVTEEMARSHYALMQEQCAFVKRAIKGLLTEGKSESEYDIVDPN